MGIFRPNKLGYTSEDVEKKSNSYIMSLVDDFKEKINGIVEKFKSDINDAVVEQNNKLNSKADKETVETHLKNINNPHNVTATQVGAYSKEEIGDIENLVEIYGKETVPDRMVSAILNNKYAIDSLGYDCSQKADKTEVDLKADKATTLSGYGIEDAYNKNEVNGKLLAIDGRYKTAEYADIDSLYDPCIYHITDNDKHNGWLLVTHYTEEYEDHHYGTMIGNAFCQLYFHENDNYEGVLEKRTGTNGRWTEWESIGNGSVDLSNVSDKAFLDKLNAVLPDGDEVSY